MKIAIVHDYFTQMGGAEKVAEEFCRIIPQADLFATVALPSKMPPSLRDVKVHTTWMQRLPFLSELYRVYFPLYPLAVRALELTEYDLVLSSSSSYVKGLMVHPDAIHVCYCHTPTRWVWSYKSYSARESFRGGVKALLPALLKLLKRWDIQAARQPDHFIANSHIVAARIQAAYGRTAAVIEPPIDVHRFSPSSEQEDFFIVLARLVPYKRIDLAVEAFTRLGKRLIIIGSGTDLKSLQSLAGPTIEFKGRLSDADVGWYVERCRALIFPGEEDFGMAPLEVAAAGRPTIAFRAGGAMETIVEGETGLFFEQQSVESLMDVVQVFEQHNWSQERIRSHAEQYSQQVFADRICEFLAKVGVPIGPDILPSAVVQILD